MARRSAGRLTPPSGLVVTTRIVGTTLAYLAVLSLALVGLYALVSSLLPDPARGTFVLLALGLAYAAALAIVLLSWRIVDRRSFWQLGLHRQQAMPAWLRGAAVGTVMMGFVVVVGYTLLDGAAWQVNPHAGQAALVLVIGLIGFAIQGPTEEVLFRGYILENVRGQWGVRWAVIVSSVGFGLFHAANPGFGPLPFINLVLFGAGTALYRLYVDGGQLWGVFAIHTVWNWLQQVVFGLPNSGIASGPDYALFSITPNMALPDLFWGGGFGPEGTLGATFVLLALILGSLRSHRGQPIRSR